MAFLAPVQPGQRLVYHSQKKITLGDLFSF